MNEKIQPTHLDRAAFVYVRQSTMHQVRNNLESQRRQYNLTERARTLGFRVVKVIDDDLGRSGSGSKERPGFARLVGSICAGEAGAVLALEASRLARNNRDWHHLIDLCAMTDTLVIDHDGIYDPRQLNDRLLLGLKGTMSEFELSLLHQRAQESLRQMIQRGEVLWNAPIGYVRTEHNGIEMTPDLRVQDTMRNVFAKFAEFGSARQVLLWYCQNKLPLPVWSEGAGKRREVLWRPAIYGRIHKILTNPVYAGAFVHGRRRTRTVMVDGRARKTAGHMVPPEQWDVMIKDHHPGYISWETYVQNQRQIEQNSGKDHHCKGAGTGAARSGSALLAGLLRCARCGRKLKVAYCGVGGRRVRYCCNGANLSQGEAKCISVGGPRVEEAVVAQVLEALQPTGIEAALEAWRQLQQQGGQKQKALQLAVEQARYESDRIRRQYDATEPENRLVATELERRWEEALQRVTELQAQFAAASKPREELSEAERIRLLDLGGDLETLWRHPAASSALKKRILRTVLEEVIIDLQEEPPRVHLVLHWAGGVHTELVIRKSPPGRPRHSASSDCVELVRQLACVCNDVSIAAILNRLGHRTGLGNTWIESRVRALRSHNQIPAFDPALVRSWLTLKEAASELNISRRAVEHLLAKRILPGRQLAPFAPWMIERPDLQLPAVQSSAIAIRNGRKAPCSVDGKSQLQLFQR